MSYWFYNVPSVKYKGLQNQGATCYLNSVLQVLFMTEDFREAVERHIKENPGTDCIDRQLNSLFAELNKRAARTDGITTKLGIKRVYEQHDAVEYFEKILSLTSNEASQIFHGMLTHRSKCSAGHEGADTDALFWHLPLTLVDTNTEYSVVNGIEEFFRPSYFSGENQMYCEQCDAKCDATFECVVKHHPEVLMLLLKRFDLDYYSMTYFKINRSVRVPSTLQVSENQTYELYAYVEHVGDLRNGHYTATIKSQEDDRWYNFNDSSVTLPENQPFKTETFERSDSAYLLLYRNKTARAADPCSPQDNKEVFTPEGSSSPTIDDKCQEAAKRSEEEEDKDEGAAELTKVTDISGEPGIKDITVNGQPRGEGLSHDPNYHVEDQEKGVDARQSVTYDDQECDEKRNDVYQQGQEKQRDEGGIIAGDEEVKGEKAEADNQAEDESQREESVDDQGDISDMPGRQEQSPSVCVDMQTEMEVGDEKRDRDGQIEDDEQTEKRGKGQHQDHEGLDDVRQDTKGDLGVRQEVGRDFDPKSVDKQGGEKRTTRDFKADSGVKIGAEESGKRSKSQDDVRVGDRKQNMAKDHQKWKQRSFSSFEQHGERKRDVERVLQRGELLMTKRPEDSDDVRQKRPQISATHPAHIETNVAGNQEKRGDEEQTRDRGSSSSRRAGRTGSGRMTESSQGEVMMRRDGAECDQDVGKSSKKSGALTVRIYEEETKHSPSGAQRSSEMREISIEAHQEAPQEERKSSVGRKKLKALRNLFTIRPKRGEKSLSEGLGNLQVSEASQKHGVKRVIENVQEENKTNPSQTKKVKGAPGTQEQAAGIKHKTWKRWRNKHGKDKKKKRKTISCFNLLKKKQTSDSE
uniref:uncharacterized protein n=1 Tax=Semicossyphus pulcher TaxID=241346 RepID=UPI0037E9C451